jgi:hypothetical protein
MASRIYEPLEQYAAQIAGSADQQTVPYVEATWREWLNRAAIHHDVVEQTSLPEAT